MIQETVFNKKHLRTEWWTRCGNEPTISKEISPHGACLAMLVLRRSSGMEGHDEHIYFLAVRYLLNMSSQIMKTPVVVVLQELVNSNITILIALNQSCMRTQAVPVQPTESHNRPLPQSRSTLKTRGS